MRAKQESSDGDQGPPGLGVCTPSIASYFKTCQKCRCHRGEASPLDKTDTTRAWGGGELCRWCEAVDATDASGKPGDARIAGDLEQQKLALQAYFSLVMEGGSETTQQALLSRMEVLRAVIPVMAVSPTDAESSGGKSSLKTSASPSSTRGSASRSAASSAATTIAATGRAVHAFITPMKRQRSQIFPSVDCGMAREGLHAEALEGTLLKEELDDSQCRPTVSSPAPASESGSNAIGAPSAKGLGTSKDIKAEHLEIDEWSVSAPLPACSLGSSMTRMRGTVNHYSKRVFLVKWMSAFKEPTVKALQRRLDGQAEKVAASLHVELRESYLQLKVRVRSLLTLFKHVAAWCMTFSDEGLMNILSVSLPLDKYRELVGAEWAPDLHILLLRCKFVKSLRTTTHLAAAFEILDKDELFEVYQKLHDQLESYVEEEEEEESQQAAEEDDSHEVAGGLASADASKGSDKARKTRHDKKSTKPKKAVANNKKLHEELPSGPVDFAVLVADKAVQLKLFELPTGEQMKEAIAKLVDDLQGACELWSTTWSTEDAANPFFEVMSAILVVLRSFLSAPDAPKSSEVRSARKVVHAAADGKNENKFKCAQGMLHYRVAKLVMEESRLVASAGLQDEAADEQFTHMMASIEGDMALAFEGYPRFLDEDNGGSPHDVKSLCPKVEKVRTWAADLQQMVGTWSRSRLEEQVEDVEACIEYCMSIFDFAVVVLVRECTEALDTFPIIDRSSCAAMPVESPMHAKAEPAMGDDGDAGDVAVAEIAEAKCDHVASHREAICKLSELINKRSIFWVTFAEGTCQPRLAELWGTVVALRAKGGDALAAPSVANYEGQMELLVRLPKLLAGLAGYMGHIEYLIEKAPLSSTTSVAEPSNQEYLSVLTKFCFFHRQLMDGEYLVFDWKDTISHIMENLGLCEKIRRFEASVGCTVYDTHVKSSLEFTLQGLEGYHVEVQAVESTIIGNHEKLPELLSFLIVRPSFEVLAKEAEILKDVVGFDKTDAFAHNILLSSLAKFLSSAGLENVPMASLRKASTIAGDIEVPWHRAQVFLTTQALVRDVAVIAARVHCEHFLAGDKLPSVQTLDDIAFILKLLGEALSKLDTNLHSTEVRATEGEGWYASTSSFTVLRHWQAGLAVVRGKAVTLWLQRWVALLTAHSTKVKSELPAWQACFQGGEVHRALAASVNKGKLTRVVEGHNKIHKLLSAMTTGATTIGVSPVLSKHVETQAGIAECLHVMESMKVASCVLQGLDIIVGYQNHHLGPQKAATFLKSWPDDKRPPAIPDVLWSELHSLRADMTTNVSVSAAPDGAQVSSPVGGAAVVGSSAEAPASSASSSALASAAAVKREIVKPGAGPARLKRRRQ